MLNDFAAAAGGSGDGSSFQHTAASGHSFSLREEFMKAHDGPPEKIGVPQHLLVLQPEGTTVELVHKQVDEIARQRYRLRAARLRSGPVGKAELRSEFNRASGASPEPLKTSPGLERRLATRTRNLRDSASRSFNRAARGRGFDLER